MRRMRFGASFDRWAGDTTITARDPAEATRDYEQGGVMIASGAPTERTLRAIVVPLTNEDLRYAEGGTYTRHDRKVYLQHPDSLNKGQDIEHDGKTYQVQEKKPYTEHTDVSIYFVRRLEGEGR